MDKKMEDYLNKKSYLPKVLKNQKVQDLLFTRLQIIVDNRNNGSGVFVTSHLEELTKESGQEYIVNAFLRYMAEHGYTLQKSRKRVMFEDLEADLNRFEQNEPIQTEMKIDLKRYLAEGSYLPNPIKDFHDCKVVFKMIGELLQSLPQSSLLLENMNWSTAHVYTVDVFLWYLAKHGYTLQMSRKKIDFSCINSEVANIEHQNMIKKMELIHHIIKERKENE